MVEEQPSPVRRTTRSMATKGKGKKGGRARSPIKKAAVPNQKQQVIKVNVQKSNSRSGSPKGKQNITLKKNAKGVL